MLRICHFNFATCGLTIKVQGHLDAANWRTERVQPLGLERLPKMNPEMSGSELESSGDEGHGGHAIGPADSDDEFPCAGRPSLDDDEEEDDDDALPEEEAEEEHDDDDDDDDEEASKTPPTLTMHKWLEKPSVVAEHKKKSAAQTIEMAKSYKQKAMRTGSDSAWGPRSSQKAPDKPSKPSKPSKQSKPQDPKAPMPPQANDDSDDDLASMTMTDLSKPKWPTYPPDAV